MSNKSSNATIALIVFGIIFIGLAFLMGYIGYTTNGFFVLYIIAFILFFLGIMFFCIAAFVRKAKHVKDKVSNIFNTISNTTNSIKNDTTSTTTTTSLKKTYTSSSSSSFPGFVNPFDMLNMMFGNDTVKEAQEVHYCEYCGSEVDMKKKKCDSCGAKIIKTNK